MVVYISWEATVILSGYEYVESSGHCKDIATMNNTKITGESDAFFITGQLPEK